MSEIKYLVRGKCGPVTCHGESGDFECPRSVGHGIDCPDNFADYFGNDKLLRGFMRFEIGTDGELYTLTEWYARERLTDAERSELADYTQGQWSDGIGEGFEQSPCAEYQGFDVYISPWFHGQVVTVEEVIE